MPVSTTATAVDPFSPTRLGPVQLRNRFIKAATFEGMAVGNLVTDHLIEFHCAMARGGVAMTTVAYLAVGPTRPSAGVASWLKGPHVDMSPNRSIELSEARDAKSTMLDG